MTKIAPVYRLRFRLFRRMLETGVPCRGAKNQRFRMLMPPSLQPPLESAQQLISIGAWIFGLEGLENLARSRCGGRRESSVEIGRHRCKRVDPRTPGPGRSSRRDGGGPHLAAPPRDPEPGKECIERHSLRADIRSNTVRKVRKLCLQGANAREQFDRIKAQFQRR